MAVELQGWLLIVFDQYAVSDLLLSMPVFGQEFEPVALSDQSSIPVVFVVVMRRVVLQMFLLQEVGAIASHNWNIAQIFPGGPKWHYRLCMSLNSLDS